MDNAQIIGRLTNNVDLRYTGKGVAVARFNVAVNKGNDNKTIYFPCEVWEEKAINLAKYVVKGQMVGITGHHDMDEWADSAGVKHSRMKIVCHTIDYLAKPFAAKKTKTENNQDALPEEYSDEIPM